LDKLQELLLTVSATLIGICAWIVKKLWGRLDKLESRVDQLYVDRLKKSDLDKIVDLQHLILQNLLNKKHEQDKDNR
jgi:hypothetical protein